MKKCILVVDDDSMNLTRTQMILGKRICGTHGRIGD